MPSRIRALAAAHDYEQARRGPRPRTQGPGFQGLEGCESTTPQRLCARCLAPYQAAPLPPPSPIYQVCAEYKKANALIRPGRSTTAEVWARLHEEIEKVRACWEGAARPPPP